MWRLNQEFLEYFTLHKYVHVGCELLHSCYRTCLKKSVRNIRAPRNSFLFRGDPDSRVNQTERSPRVATQCRAPVP